MIPCLFNSDAISFNTNGLGTLKQCIKCNVIQELGSSGVYELEMDILADDPLFQFIQVGNIIGCYPNLTGEPQGFVIEQISKPIDNLVSVYATHIAQHRAKLIPVANFNANNLQDALSKIATNSLETNPFSLTSNRSVATSYSIATPRSFRDILGGKEGSLLDVYGGEYIFNNFSIQLVAKRGRNNGVQILYGQNMTEFDMKEEFDWNQTITGIMPYWYTEDDGLVQGSIQYSDYVNYFKYHKTIVKDYTDEFENQPSANDLNTIAAADVKNLGFPRKNIKVAFNQFEEKIIGDVNIMQLGDTVTIINPNYDVNMTSRIVSMDFNVLSEQYNEIQVGEIEQTINQAIAEVKM